MLRPFVLIVVLFVPVTTLVSVCRACVDYPLTKDDIPAGIAADVRVLIEQLFDADIARRSEAAKRLSAMHDRAAAAVPFLMERLDDYGPRERFGQCYAFAALVEIGEPALDACIAHVNAVTAAASQAKYFNDPSVYCLGRFRSPRAVDVLLELLESKHRDVRNAALESLHGCTDTRATPVLLRHIGRRGGHEQRDTIACFESLRDPRAVEPLLKLLAEYGPGTEFYWLDLSESVVRALGGQRDRRAVPDLLKIVQRPNGDRVNYAAAVALGKIGDPRGIRFLVEAFSWPAPRDPESVSRADAAHGLAQFRAEFADPGDEWNEARILELLVGVVSNEAEDEFFRMSVAEALGEFDNPGAIAALCKVTEKHSHDGLGFTAAASAVKLSDGKLDDVWVVRAIKNRPDPGIESSPDEEKESALAKLKANAGPTAQAELAVATGSQLIKAHEHFPNLLPRALCLVGIAAGIGFLVRRRWKHAF